MANSKKDKRGRPSKWNQSNIQPLIDIYESGKTLQEVGAVYNISHERVRQIFKEMGYHNRRYTSTERGREKLAQAGRARRIVLPKEKLEKLYWNEKLTIKEIAKLLNVRPGIVHLNFIRHDIARRSRREVALLCLVKNPHLTKEKLYQLYIVENKSQSKIGKMFGYSPMNIAKLVAKYGYRKIKGEAYEKRYGRFKNFIKTKGENQEV